MKFKFCLFLLISSCVAENDLNFESETIEFRDNSTEIFETTSKNSDFENPDLKIFEQIQKQAFENLNWKIKKIDGNMSYDEILKLVCKPKKSLACHVKIPDSEHEYEECCEYIHAIGLVGLSKCCSNYHSQNYTICNYTFPIPSIN